MTGRFTGWLLLVICAVTAVLSIKTVVDLAGCASKFPRWFVPSFVLGLLALLVYAGYMTHRVWRARDTLEPRGGPAAICVWVLLAVSFVSTTAVHRFHPFLAVFFPGTASAYFRVSPLLQLNFAIAAVGFLATAILGGLYCAGWRRGALLCLTLLAPLLLVPNDACPNPFNCWWRQTLGASPLMYVPNLYALMLGAAALLGLHPRLNLAALACVSCATGLFGLGHMTRVIW